ncbi:RmlC-like cupins superfamily protein [Klebsormidium nitens]|uniref:RmlC-like cupins superfamily protein n=1 Tax=Klebsormidium nitens TaxID=105231 RepID=A0A1Y1I376_KLENI|nr:RmlC-like cupins superfamily protein [Klebsormidium nitens]|eukprot:GAQ85384.1 RmlC-like cupins superfamily protein [Klebsormidium nitens]
MARALLAVSGLSRPLSVSCGGYELIPPGPKEVFKSEGGSLRQWGPSTAVEKWARVGVKELILEPGGMLLPQYSNAQSLGYVLEGSARAELIDPVVPTSLRRLKQGDVVVLPEGHVFGLHNDGSEIFKILGVDRGTERACGLDSPTNFTLFGNRDDKSGGASILNGFSKDVLAAAFNVDEPTVEQLLPSEKGASIIKLDKKKRGRGRAHGPTRAAVDWPLGDMRFNLEETPPDIVNKGGSYKAVTVSRLPSLEKVDISAAYATLKPDAIFAPSRYFPAHRVTYFTRGKGRIQVAAPGGTNALDQEVSAGQLVVIPKNFPFITMAARDSPLEWVDLYMACSSLCFCFVAGNDSVYKALPFDWLVTGFNADPEIEKVVLRARTDDAFISTRPPKKAVVSSGPTRAAKSTRPHLLTEHLKTSSARYLVGRWDAPEGNM